MLATATRNFVEEVDRGGALIPVSSLNDTISLLTVVIKKKRFWFWQQPKYLPTDFTLNDLLAGDTPIQPVTTELEFIKYKGTFGDNIQGNVDASFSQNASVSLEGKDTSKLQSSFGSLKKEELAVQNLIRDSKERLLDMSHSLVEQTMMNHKQVFGIVKERIVTTQPCSVIEEVQKEGQFGGLLTICGPKVTKISLKENASLGKDSNVTMEIPPQTTLAYALIELEVKHDGHFTLCLMSGINGGFEEVDRGHLNDLGAPPLQTKLSNLKQNLAELKEHFDVLAALPALTKSSLFQKLTTVISDRAAVSSLQNALNHLRHADATASAEEQEQTDILNLVSQCGQSRDAVIQALHLLLSAIDEMPSEAQALLGTCCSPGILAELNLVVTCLLEGGELPLSSMRQTTASEEVFGVVQLLFSSSRVTLTKAGDCMRAEVQKEARQRPLVLCIAVRALASLSQ
ncbi:unnamed protein product [Knipowitschia caucasica]